MVETMFQGLKSYLSLEPKNPIFLCLSSGIIIRDVHSTQICGAHIQPFAFSETYFSSK